MSKAKIKTNKVINEEAYPQTSMAVKKQASLRVPRHSNENTSQISLSDWITPVRRRHPPNCQTRTEIYHFWFPVSKSVLFLLPEKKKKKRIQTRDLYVESSEAQTADGGEVQQGHRDLGHQDPDGG